MEFESFEQWREQLIPFLKGWEEKMNTVLGQDQVIEFFLNNYWGDFELEFDMHIKGNLPQSIRPQLATPEGKRVVNHMVALLDLKKSLDSALDGEASLSARDYLLTLTDHLSEMRTALERLVPREPTLNVSLEDLEVTEEPEPVGDDMVEQVVDIGEDGEKIMQSKYDSVAVNTARKNNPLLKKEGRPSAKKGTSGLLPRAKRKRNTKNDNYDSGLHLMDPIASGPIVSLAGKKKSGEKDNTKNSKVTRGSAPSAEVPLDSQLLSAFRNAINRVGSGEGAPGELDLLENLALQFFTHNPQNPDNIIQEIKDLDHRLSIIGGEEGEFKVEAIMVTDRLSAFLHREIEAVTAMAGAQFLRMHLTAIEEKDGHEGEYRTFTLDFSTKTRVIGFHKGQLRFTLLYYPRVVRLTVKAIGLSRLGAPFTGDEATVLIDYNEKSDGVLLGFAMRALSAFISQVLS